MRVRNDLTSQDLYDATLRFLDLLRASKAFQSDPQEARIEALHQVEVFLNALVADDERMAA